MWTLYLNRWIRQADWSELKFEMSKVPKIETVTLAHFSSL
jgi:hypothetical protein